MGSVYLRVPRNETEAPVNFFLTSGGGVAGATVLYAVRDGDTPDSWLDFNDNTFKTVGWTTRQTALTGSATQAGLYTAVPGLDLSAMINLPAATDVLVIEFEVTAPAGLVGFAFDYLLIDERVEDLDVATDTWDALRAAHNVGGSFGESVRLDAAGLATDAAQEIRDEILSDSTPFAGANIDASISSRSQPGDAMALTAGAVDDIWDELQAGHVTPGTFGFFLDAAISSISGMTDWSAAEREEIRFRLGMTGVQTDPTIDSDLARGGITVLDILGGNTRVIDDGGGNWVEEHLDFATGTSVVRRYDLFGFDQTSQVTNANNPFLDAGLDPNAGFMLRTRTL